MRPTQIRDLRMLQLKNLRKKLLYSIPLIYALSNAQITNAQITLEHTFINESVTFNMGIVNGQANYVYESVTQPENSYYFTKIVDNSYHIKSYNSDYSLNTDKTYQFTPPLGYKVSTVSLSKKLFNTDENYEFMVVFVKTSSVAYDNDNSKAILYDTNLNVIKDFGTGAGLYISPYLYIIDNQYKLLICKIIYDTGHNQLTNSEIYSVPGTHTSINVSEQKANVIQSAYPNPTISSITLPYQLKQGEISVMRIFNINGLLIESKQIDFVFDKILLNVSEYAKGVYFYEVNGVSNRFVVN